MLKQVVLFLILLSSGFAQEPRAHRHSRSGECAGYASRDATILSMMGWGLGLGAGIAVLCALIPDNTGGGHSHSH